MKSGNLKLLARAEKLAALGKVAASVAHEIRNPLTGSGIPHELLDSIFDPFVSERKNGVGLGLSVAYQIVNRHEGWMEAANNPDGGATFTVSLPVGELAKSAK